MGVKGKGGKKRKKRRSNHRIGPRLAKVREECDDTITSALVASNNCGLSNQAARALAERFKVHVVTIRRRQALMVARFAEQSDPSTLPARKSRAVQRLWGIAGKAERDRDYRAAVMALTQAAKIEGIEAPIQFEGTLTLRREPADMAREILAAVPECCEVLGIPAPSPPLLSGLVGEALDAEYEVIGGK